MNEGEQIRRFMLNPPLVAKNSGSIWSSTCTACKRSLKYGLGGEIAHVTLAEIHWSFSVGESLASGYVYVSKNNCHCP